MAHSCVVDISAMLDCCRMFVDCNFSSIPLERDKGRIVHSEEV